MAVHTAQETDYPRACGGTEVEAALIDAYPGLTNRMLGEGSKDRGIRHADEIIRQYTAEEFLLKHRLIMFTINKTHVDHDPYDAVRGTWAVNKARAESYKLVLARVGKMVVGAYKPTEWLDGMDPRLPFRVPGKFGFIGEKADEEIWNHYVGKRVPAQYLGPQIGFRYLTP